MNSLIFTFITPKAILADMLQLNSTQEKAQNIASKTGEEEWAPYFFNLPLDEKRELLFKSEEHLDQYNYQGNPNGLIASYSSRLAQALILYQELAKGSEKEIRGFKELREWCDYDRLSRAYLGRHLPAGVDTYLTSIFDFNRKFAFFCGETSPQQEMQNEEERAKLDQFMQLNDLITKNASLRFDALEGLLTPQREKYVMELKLQKAGQNGLTHKI